MSFRPRSYPHPVLSPYSRDYTDSSELYGVFQRSAEEGHLRVSYDLDLTSTRLDEFLADSRAKFALNLYSKGTRWKELRVLDHRKGEFVISEGLLFGTLEITPLLVVHQAGEFELSGHNSEYGNSRFQLEEGDLLAFGPTEALEVDHERSSDDIEAFITLALSPGDPDVYEVIDGGSQIIVSAGENVMSVVNVMRAENRLHPYLFMSIYKNAFVFAIESILADFQRELDPEGAWATGLLAFIDSAGLSLDEITGEKESVERFVQRMLASDGVELLAKNIKDGKALT